MKKIETHLYEFGAILLFSLMVVSCSSFRAKSKTDKLGRWIGPNERIALDMIEQFKLWALQGDGDASYALSIHCRFPNEDAGCKREDGIKWLRLAAVQGNTSAMQSLSLDHYNDSVHPAAKLEGELWKLLAADFGDKTALEFIEIEKTDTSQKRLRVVKKR